MESTQQVLELVSCLEKSLETSSFGLQDQSVADEQSDTCCFFGVSALHKDLRVFSGVGVLHCLLQLFKESKSVITHLSTIVELRFSKSSQKSVGPDQLVPRIRIKLNKDFVLKNKSKKFLGSECKLKLV